MKTRSGYLFQRKKGGNWYVRTVVDGKAIVKCTGTTKRREAEKLKTDIMAPYMLGNEVNVLEAVQTRLSGRKAKLAQLEDELKPPPPVEEVWSCFMGSPARPDSGEATLERYHSEWKRFAAWLKKEHPQAKTLRDVTPAMAAAYAKELSAARLSASTFNQHRNLLRMVWRVLEDECKLTVNPWNKITPKKLTPLANRKRALTPAQFESLLAAVEADPDLKDLFILLAWTGLRRADAVLMKWGSIDFSTRVITLAPMKTARRQGKLVHIPIFPAALEVLNRRQSGRALNPRAYIFPKLAASYERDGATLTRTITSAFEKAGMQTNEERSDRKRSVAVYGAHSLRHFFTTAATAAGMPDAMIKSITGHTTDGMLEHYQQIGADIASELATRIEGNRPDLSPKALPGPLEAIETQNEALKKKILKLANKLNSKNWREIKGELKQALVD